MLPILPACLVLLMDELCRLFEGRNEQSGFLALCDRINPLSELASHFVGSVSGVSKGHIFESAEVNVPTLPVCLNTKHPAPFADSPDLKGKSVAIGIAP